MEDIKPGSSQLFGPKAIPPNINAIPFCEAVPFSKFRQLNK